MMHNLKLTFRHLTLMAFCIVLPANVEAQNPEQEIDYYNDLAYQTFRSGDKLGAAKYFLLYLEEPARRGMTQAQQDSLYQEDGKVYDYAAVNGIDIFYTNKDMDGVLKILPYAKRVNPGVANVYIFGISALKSKGDSIAAHELLKEGLVRCPHCQEMANEMVEYMQKQPDHQQAIKEIDELLAKSPENPKLWYAKGLFYYNVLQDQVSARDCFSKSLNIDDMQAEANAAMGATYIKDILDQKDKYPMVFGNLGANANHKEYVEQLAEVQPYYFNAKRYLEVARHVAPEDTYLWGYNLLQCYKYLNLKADYDALKALMPQQQ